MVGKNVSKSRHQAFQIGFRKTQTTAFYSTSRLTTSLWRCNSDQAEAKHLSVPLFCLLARRGYHIALSSSSGFRGINRLTHHMTICAYLLMWEACLHLKLLVTKFRHIWLQYGFFYPSSCQNPHFNSYKIQ